MKKTWRIPLIAGFAIALTSCVGYGYPGTGSGYGTGYPPSGGGYGSPGYGNSSYGNTIRCESNNNRTNYCSANTRGGVRLSRQISGSRCIQGRTWGYESNRIWVSQGCRAEFITGTGGASGPGYGNPGNGNPGYGNGQVVRCESQDGRHRRCNVPVSSDVQLSKQLSNTRCIQGRNWGWDRSGIWVNGGCRGEFRVY